jgi:hypothetical protein
MRARALAPLLLPAVAHAGGGDLLEVALVLMLFFAAAFGSMIVAVIVAWSARRRATPGWVQASGITLALSILATSVISLGAAAVGVHLSAVLMIAGPGALSLSLAAYLHRQAKAACAAKQAAPTR